MTNNLALLIALILTLARILLIMLLSPRLHLTMTNKPADKTNGNAAQVAGRVFAALVAHRLLASTASFHARRPVTNEALLTQTIPPCHYRCCHSWMENMSAMDLFSWFNTPWCALFLGLLYIHTCLACVLIHCLLVYSLISL